MVTQESLPVWYSNAFSRPKASYDESCLIEAEVGDGARSHTRTMPVEKIITWVSCSLLCRQCFPPQYVANSF